MFSLHWYLVAVKEKYKPLSPSFWKCIITVLPLCFDKTPIIKSERKVDEIAHFGNVFIWREVVLIKKFKKKLRAPYYFKNVSNENIPKT